MALTKHLASYTDPDGPEPALRTLKDLEPESVVPFLRQNMRWVITDTASRIIGDRETVGKSGLEVSVWDRVFVLPGEGAPMGVYGPATLWGNAVAENGGVGGV